jgi:hypothetical protein
MSLVKFLIGNGPAPGKAQRDPRVDALRGLALLMIFINHIPANPLAAFTLASWGVADAADLFVLLAGFSAAMAYGARIDREGLLRGSAPVLRRAGVLYGVQALLFIGLTLLVLFAMRRFDNPLYAETVNIWPMLDDPLRALGFAAILRFQPFFLDILPLYIVLLAAFPLIYVAARRSPGLTLLASLGLWGAARGFGWNFPGGPGHGGWYFNPFAWQLIFTIGVVSSLWVRAHGLWRPSRLVAGLGLGILVAGFLTRSPWSEVWQIASLPAMPEAWMLSGEKTSLAIERVVYALAFVALSWRLVAPGRVAASPGLRWLSVMGRHSLAVFALATMLSMAAHVAVVESGLGLVGFMMVSVLGALLLSGLGSILDWRSKKVLPASRPAFGAGSPPQAAPAA